MWPWDWVLAAGSGLSGLTQKAVNWVNSLIASVMSWVTSAITSLWGAIYSAWADINHVWNAVLGWVGSISVMVASAIDRLAHVVSNWILGLVGAIWAYIQSLYTWALNNFNAVWKFVNGLAGDIYGWVIREIYNPLVGLYNDLRTWLVQDFNTVWQYIQHPELLVKLLGTYLLSAWLALLKQYAVPLTRWIIASMKSMAGEVFDLLEEVISNII